MTEPKTADPIKKQKRTGQNKKLEGDTLKLLASISERINRKARGRKVKDREIIGFALKLISNEHVTLLQEGSYTERDRIELFHEQYCKTNGKISLDQFLGGLIRGDISLKNS
ncbi:MAG: hypothetical protein KF681_08840 [Bdellovibrionaceae bacterium]|nr:hypothetical protein [Pseudobdellovibrionaceae bacterium]